MLESGRTSTRTCRIIRGSSCRIEHDKLTLTSITHIISRTSLAVGNIAGVTHALIQSLSDRAPAHSVDNLLVGGAHAGVVGEVEHEGLAADCAGVVGAAELAVGHIALVAHPIEQHSAGGTDAGVV